MKKIRILIIAAVLVALLIPASVSAAGVFYCSTLIETGGTGTWADPWACSTQDQFDHIVNDVICRQYGGGHLYEIFTDYYVYYQIEWDGEDCDVVYTSRYPGYPPDTGVELPMPLILSLAVAGGAALLLVGFILRRKKSTS